MSTSLNDILNKGSESLANSRVGVDVAGHNISNAHTDGYSRQLVNLESKMPHQYGLHIFGDGARVQSISRAHDGFLENQLKREVQIQSRDEALSAGLQKLEGLFNPDLTSTIRDRLVSFSNAVRDLGNSPEEPATRINVVENGRALVQAIHSAHSSVAQIQNDATDEINQYTRTLNEKIAGVAKLNEQIREMEAGGHAQANDLEDKQDKLIRDIGTLIDINVYKDKNDQLIVRGPNECLLVEGDLHSTFTLESAASPKDMPRLMVSEFEKQSFTDVTNKTHRGKVGALLEIRDKHAKQLRQSINELANGFGNEFNQVHRQGYGLNEYNTQKGRDFFIGLNGPGEPAQDISIDLVIASNPNAIATAMSSETSGDNVVANKLVKIFYEPYFDHKSITITGLYDKMIAVLGHDTAQAKEGAVASKVVFDKLKAQRESFSGVSLDEEAASLLKYQHLFNASSKLITTADEMIRTILELKR